MIVTLRSAAPPDAPAIADVLLRSRAAAMPWLVEVHGPDEVRHWVEHRLIPAHRTWVAVEEGRVVGVAALDDGWLEQLCVAPEAQGRGVGRALLDVVKQHSGGRLRLHVLQRNARAQRFCTAAGFVVVGSGDGRDSAEHEPHLVMAWPEAEAEAEAEPEP